MESATKTVTIAAAKNFVSKCITAAGALPAHSDQMAETLIMADHRGHYSHGMNRLEMYVNDLRQGIADGHITPEILKESPATAHVDGRNGLGPVVGKFCIDLAIKKAKEVGVGWVVAKGSNHYGIAGYYALQASNQGLVGMSVTNTSPLVMPTRGKVGTLGTNPISFAAPAQNDDSFVLDMATTTVALGKIELNERKGIPIPEGWGADKNGQQTTDPKEVLNGGGMLPLGGSEETSGYKGYGLAMMVEVLCGILGGSSYSTNIRRWGTTGDAADLGQCFIAVNPAMFADGFQGRMQDLMDTHRQLTPTDPEKPVLVAGDPSRINMKKCKEIGGIPYPARVIEYMNGVGKTLSVAPM